MKRAVKRAVQGVVAAAAPAIWRARGAELLVLMYHRVLPPDHAGRASEQPGMYVSPSTLELHMQVLKESFEPVHLDEWLQRRAAGQPLPARACAVTFDDGWRDNHDHALPVLRRMQMPAMIFLVSDLVGTRYSFWPNTLAQRLLGLESNRIQQLPPWLRAALSGPMQESRIGMEVVDAAIDHCKTRYRDAELQQMLREWGVAETSSEQERDLMDWDEIRRMQAGGLVRFGSHTRRHTRLSGVVQEDELRDEIVGSRDAIAAQLGTPPTVFCYPNGDTSARAIELVRGAYRGAVTTVHGWNAPAADPCTLRRIGVHDDVSATRSAFMSRVTGVG